MNRPALAEVLAALTARDGDPDLIEFWRVVVRDFDPPARLRNVVIVADEGASTEHRIPSDGTTVGAHVRGVAMQPWTVTTPFEALEILHVRDLWPWPTDGEGAARWWDVRTCLACGGRGQRTHAIRQTLPERLSDYPSETRSLSMSTEWRVCQDCGGRQRVLGITAAPPSIVDLVAVASLGCDALRTIVNLCGELEHKAAVVWRVMSKDALREWANAAHRWGGPIHTTVDMAASIAAWEMAPHVPHDGAPWWNQERLPVRQAVSADLERAWPALRDLARAGVHLIECTPDRIVIGVESVS